jgi:hypothetical protein
MLCMPIFQSMSFSASCDWGADLVTLLTKWAVHSWAYVMLSRAFSQITWITKFKGFPWCGVWLNNVNCVTLRHTLVAWPNRKLFSSPASTWLNLEEISQRSAPGVAYTTFSLSIYLPPYLHSHPPTTSPHESWISPFAVEREGGEGGWVREVVFFLLAERGFYLFWKFPYSVLK